MDRYKRILGNVYLGEEWVNLELVKAGLAWHYKFYSKDKTMAAAETKAKPHEPLHPCRCGIGWLGA